MSTIIDRFSRLLRAEIESRLGGWEAQAERRRARRASRAGQAPPREPQGSAAPVGRDPVLAGYYANLEVPYGSDLETVEEARKRLLKKYHPDLHGRDPERQRTATELVQGLNHAFEQLRRHLERSA